MRQLEHPIAHHDVRYHRTQQPQNTGLGTNVFNITATGSTGSAPVPTPKQRLSRLPDHLQPIRVDSTQPILCPMRGCAVPLDANDSVWCAHYKGQHHDQLCITAHCGHDGSAACTAQCPFPMVDCTTCTKGTMTVGNVGRHLLNVHVKVVYQCPVCGIENEWRHSSCARHIRACVENNGKP